MEAMEGEGDKSWLEMLTLGCVSADCFTTRKSKAKNLISVSSFNDLVSLPQREITLGLSLTKLPRVFGDGLERVSWPWKGAHHTTRSP